jgi:hypothetical protein
VGELIMGKYWRLMADYDAETTTYSATAGTNGASPFTPPEDARLVGLKAMIAAEAATSLVEAVQFRLTCTTFKPNSIECGVNGAGLQTAPALQQAPEEWSIDQPVKAGVPISIEARNLVGSPVTCRVYLWGLFIS